MVKHDISSYSHMSERCSLAVSVMVRPQLSASPSPLHDKHTLINTPLMLAVTSKSPVPTSPTTISTPTVPTIATPARPCASEPCGLKALCKPLGEYFECTCPPGMFGNPYVECRYECVVDSDCARNRACERNKCIDPCEGVCGERAECHVIMHRPVCTCVPGFTGDAYTACNPVKVTSKHDLLLTLYCMLYLIIP